MELSQAVYTELVLCRFTAAWTEAHRGKKRRALFKWLGGTKAIILKTPVYSTTTMKQPFWARVKKAWKVTRAFLAKDDDMLSWLANLAIAFVVIKFILYPLLGMLFGASLPVVAVVSSSMDHDALDDGICGGAVPSEYSGNFNEYWALCGSWYEQRNITKEAFSSYPFKNGFDKGDIMVIVGPQRSAIKQGDVIVFEAREQYPVIHRVITTGSVYSTKGDHNAAQIQEHVIVSCVEGSPSPCYPGRRVAPGTPGSISVLDETTVAKESVIGKAVLRIPWLGYVKIWFTSLIQFLIGLFS